MLIKFILGAFFIATLAYMAIQQLPLGKISLELFGVSTTTNLPGLLLFFVGVYAAVVVTVKVLTFPKTLRSFWERSKGRVAQRKFHEALIDRLAGRVVRARKKFLRAAANKDLAHVAMLFAADCAARIGDWKAVHDAAQKAHEAGPEDDIAAQMMLASAALATGDYAVAKGVLEDLHAVAPGNTEVGVMLLRCGLCERDLAPLRSALPVVMGDASSESARETAKAAARILLEDGGADDRNLVWSVVDETLRDELSPDYALALDRAEETERAQRLLEKQIKTHADKTDALAAYGALSGGGHEQRLEQVKRWRESDPECATLLLVQGMILRRLRRYDKAMECLERSHARQASPQAAQEIALTLADKKAPGSSGARSTGSTE